ncbi:thiamine-phosphate kinase [Flavobacterium agricola]|uniref:Thiamine-monophosphate kinase n=1 Tax=Flavobacterium agricola TaxID=2870839 RepID=A0ABY6LX52_9FLAO|nr:thiamine-phosphate kinase [Flavobacterium agricola]UYW00794.1 thiamine-phosphate kinase [Flavobacterium agricola]
MIEDKNQQRTQLSQVGEISLIEHLTQGFAIENESTIKGTGDDGAVLQFENEKVVVSTDMMVEGVHFDLSFMPLKHLGYKAIVNAISDLAAMNATPTQVLLSVAVSNRFPVEALDELFDGFKTAAKVYKLDVVGGDTTSSNKGLIISVTAIGKANEEDITYRVGAGINDLIVVTGDIGAAYMGLQVLDREKQVFLVNPNNQPDLEPYSYLVERQLKPEARTDIKELLEKMEVKPTSMIDITDGLASEVMHLCKQANLGCNIYEDKLPLDPQLINVCEEFNINSTTVALNGGEDFELLFTVKMEDFDKVKHNPHLSIIGHMTDVNSGTNLVTRGNNIIGLKARGWEPENNDEDAQVVL